MKKKTDFERWHKRYFGIPTGVRTADYKSFHIEDAFNFGFNAGRRAERKKLKAKGPTKSDELLKCPFCASPSSYVSSNADGESFRECATCGASGPCVLEGEQDEAWNTRHTEAWIAVKDRLPENGRDVFSMDDCGTALTARYSELLKRFLSTDTVLSLVGITHWMEIPQIKKGDE